MHMLDHATIVPSRTSPEVAAEEFVEVTVCPSHHCPGSCLLMFEGYFGKYVYTGDIRIEEDCEADDIIPSQVDLNVSSETSSIPWSKLEGATRLFMDTTFAHPLWESLPSRSEAISSILALIGSQPSNVPVLLECEMLGTEPVLVSVSSCFGQPIFAEERVYSKLCHVPGLKAILTQDRSKSRFMVVQHGTFSRQNLDRATSGAKSIARSVHAMAEACHIKPSTQWFGANSCLKTLNVRPVLRDGVWHVLFSIHNSFSEIRRFINRIAPQSIVPLVATDFEALQRLESLCSYSSSNQSSRHGKAATQEVKTPARVAAIIGKARACIEDDPADAVIEAVKARDRRLSVEDLMRQEQHLNDDDSEKDEGSIDLSLYEFMSSSGSNSNKPCEVEQLPVLASPAQQSETVDPCNWGSRHFGNGTPVKSLFDDSFSEETSASPFSSSVDLQQRASASRQPQRQEEQPQRVEVITRKTQLQGNTIEVTAQHAEIKRRKQRVEEVSIFDLLESDIQIIQHLVPVPKKRCIEIIEVESDGDDGREDPTAPTILDLAYEVNGGES